jgi:putative hydrolase of the HAD superfamily
VKDITLPTSVIIDFDNTLYEYSNCHKLAMDSALSFFEEELNLTNSIIRDSLDLSRQQVKSSVGSVASSHSRILYAQQSLLNFGFGGKPALALQFEQIYWSRFMEEMKPLDGAVDFLSSLRFKRIPIILLTDLTSQIQIRKLICLGWENLFDYVITSELVGSEKMSGLPFEFVLNLLNTADKEHVWFIGDEMHDVPNIDSLTRLEHIQSGCGFLRDKSNIKVKNVLGFQNFSELEKRLNSQS